MGAEVRDDVGLQWAAEEMRRLASTLDGIVDHPSAESVDVHRTAGLPFDAVEQAERLLRMRRRRTSLLPACIFGEPAWDILLDLYVSEARGRSISVSSACIASAVAPTTGLRWLKTLVDEGLIVREVDAVDGRRVYVRLTEDARGRLTSLLLADPVVAAPPPSVSAASLDRMIDRP